ncbi:MAG: hypothetical protein AB8H80_23085 [Planctomycetota bacterium]
MTAFFRSRWTASLALLLLPLLASAAWPLAQTASSEASAAGELEAAAPFKHPHFPKKLTCTIRKGLELTVRYQTVTFDKKGAEKMKVGQTWHLAGSRLETTEELVMGGQKVPAGKYALSARKTKDGWSLVLHEGGGFSRPGEGAFELKTEFTPKTWMFEHLSVDVQPGGDKKSTQLFLDVRFDDMLARCAIEIPES